MSKLRLVYLGMLCIGWQACSWPMRAGTATYLRQPKSLKGFKLVPKAEIRVHPLQVAYDSSDMAAYNMGSNYRYDTGSIKQVVRRVTSCYEKLIESEMRLVRCNEREVVFEDAITADVSMKLGPFDDRNNHDVWRTLNGVHVTVPFHDSVYHLLSKAIFRQDICVGCAFSGYGREMHAVIHFKYAIIRRQEVIVYREVFVPNPLDGAKKNKLNTDAAKAFIPMMDDVLMDVVRRDLKRIIEK